MSETIEVPAGLDTLNDDDKALLDAMRDDGPEPVAEPARASEPPLVVAEAEIDFPDEPDPEPARGRSQTVPHAQFHAAREEAKAAKKLAAEADRLRADAETKLATEMARIQERVGLLTALAQQQPAAAVSPMSRQAEDEPLPDIATDPIGHFQGVIKKQNQQIEALNGVTRGFQESQEQARQARDLRDWGEGQERGFMAAEPTYADAMAYLRQHRDQELVGLGVTDPASRARIIGNDVREIALKSRAEGANFAERLYQQSLHRGFVKPAPVVDPPAVVIPPMDTAAASPRRAARLEEGRDNATTIGSVGAAPPARLSVDKIANMDEVQFAALVKRMEGNPAALRELMGN